MKDSHNNKQWLETQNEEYHTRQFNNPYRSTILFIEWLLKINCLNTTFNQTVMDLGCGMGSQLYYLNKILSNNKYIGVDINSSLIKRGKYFFKKDQNVNLFHGDLYSLPLEYKNTIDVIISFQVLSWLPDYKKPLNQMIKLKPRWICFSSLFYDGPIECEIKLRMSETDKSADMQSFYNIYSLPKIKEYLFKNGYKHFLSIPFEIDIDLSPPIDKTIGTYTKNLENGRKLQFSGPLHLPWYFVAASI